jgi:hypothetical protein
MVHMALRADVAALVDDIDDAPRDHLRRRTALLERVVYAHHVGEDDVLLPALSARVPEFDGTTSVLAAQHADLDLALGTLRHAAATRGRARGPVARAARDAEAVLLEHLVTEEREILPVWLSSFGPEDHDAFGRRLRRATPVRDIAVMVPWLLDAAPDTVKADAWSEVPFAVRAAYKLWWRRSFGRRYGSRSVALAA